MPRSNEDPKKTKARSARDAAQLQVDILCKGIGHILTEDRGRYYTEDLRRIIAVVNLDLAAAVGVLERAEKAYEPYWRRHRSRVIIRPKKKKTAA